MELISVVIPVSNRVDELKRAISSVLAQTYDLFEVLVVCNNSADPGSVDKVCHDFNDERIKFFYVEICKNANVARNYGTRIASGEYIAYLDSDDEWEPEHLDNCYALINRVNADFVYGATKIFDGEKYKIKTSRDLSVDEEPVDFLLGFKRGYAQTSSYLIRKSCFSVISWDEGLYRHQDYDYFIKMARQFKLTCNKNADVVIHWRKGELRSYHHPSVSIFLERYGKSMSFSTTLRYYLMMFHFLFSQRSFDSAFYLSLSFFKGVGKNF